MDILAEHGVAMEVNVCTTMENYHELYSIAELAAQHGCYAFCSTRYILTTSADSHLVLTQQATLELIEILTKIKDKITGIDDVSLPGPVPLCELPRTSYDAVAALNIPCQYGYGLCRVSATGKVTPCTISSDIIADLRETSFADAWNAIGWTKYACMEHVPLACKSCEEFARCRAGCVVYDESLAANGMQPTTRKWM
jgi:radical SAM protein with 4Fe4S-binding SPASM domain